MDFLVIFLSLISRWITLWSENIFWTMSVLWNVWRLALWAAYGQFWYMLYGLLQRMYFLNSLGTQCSTYMINYVKLINYVSQIFYKLSDVFFSACYISYWKKLESPTMNLYLPISISCQFCTIYFESCYLLGHRDCELFCLPGWSLYHVTMSSLSMLMDLALKSLIFNVSSYTCFFKSELACSVFFYPFTFSLSLSLFFGVSLISSI